jgi:hypothetical protein
MGDMSLMVSDGEYFTDMVDSKLTSIGALAYVEPWLCSIPIIA